MKNFFKLTGIGLFAGTILIFILKLVQELTGNTAYILLFNFEYIPLIRDLKPVWLFGYIFHFITCVISVIALYFILKLRHRKAKFYLISWFTPLVAVLCFFLPPFQTNLRKPMILWPGFTGPWDIVYLDMPWVLPLKNGFKTKKTLTRILLNLASALILSLIKGNFIQLF